jgi:hypothetical protein
MDMDAGMMKSNYSARAILKAALPRDRAALGSNSIFDGSRRCIAGMAVTIAAYAAL